MADDLSIAAGALTTIVAGVGTWLASRYAYRGQREKSAADQVQALWAQEAAARAAFHEQLLSDLAVRGKRIGELEAENKRLRDELESCLREERRLTMRVGIAEKLRQ